MTSVSRRAVLLSVAGVAVGTGVAAIAPAGATRPSARSRDLRAMAVSGSLLADSPPAETSAVRRTVSTTVPEWARRWHAPVSDLDDFLGRDHGAHYPHRAVLLTVDDGPDATWTPRYLRLFAKHEVTATFNMIGRQVRPNRHLVRAVMSEGHTISNHTWTHDEGLPYRPPADIRREIVRTNEAIHGITGHTPRQFRAPGGVWGPRVFAELARERMLPLGWDVDPRDWALPGVPAIEHAMLQARRGDIILCHDGGGNRAQTYRALERVVPELRRRGYTFLTLRTT